MLIQFHASGRAELPEISAYSRYFERHAIQFIDGGSEKSDAIKADLDWFFMGFYPLQSKRPSIHEYASLSTNPFGSVKDKLKKLSNGQPSGRIFLNAAVQSAFSFNDNAPFLFRDMGVDACFLSDRGGKSSTEFDLVYIGSMSAQRQLDRFLHSFRRNANGCRLLLIGEPEKHLYAQFKAERSLVFAGRLPYLEVPKVARQARFGLNYLPLKSPYLHQASTKVLEYSAMGMGVVSVATPWVESFFRNRQGCFLPISDVNPFITMEMLDNFHPIIPDVADLEWESMFDRIGLIPWINSIVR